MSDYIDLDALWRVAVLSAAFGVGVVGLYALGLRALAPAPAPATGPGSLIGAGSGATSATGGTSVTLPAVTGSRRDTRQAAAPHAIARIATATTPAFPPIPSATPYIAAPTSAAAGRVTIHATTIRPATDHRTRCRAPTPAPRIAP